MPFSWVVLHFAQPHRSVCPGFPLRLSKKKALAWEAGPGKGRNGQKTDHELIPARRIRLRGNTLIGRAFCSHFSPFDKLRANGWTFADSHSSVRGEPVEPRGRAKILSAVIPAQAGIQGQTHRPLNQPWIPACAGMTPRVGQPRGTFNPTPGYRASKNPTIAAATASGCSQCIEWAAFSMVVIS